MTLCTGTLRPAQPSAFIHAGKLDTARLGPRRVLNMPGVAATVAEQIEALREVAGDNVINRIRREPDPMIARIVAGWPRRFDAQRARELGFMAENSFEDIIRIQSRTSCAANLCRDPETGKRAAMLRHPRRSGPPGCRP